MKPLCSVQIELTNHCNYKCKFCPQAYYKDPLYKDTPFDRKKGYMSFETFKRSVTQCKNFAQEINFSYFGEPTLHPEYRKMFRWLKHNKGHLRIILNSNLSLVTNDIFDAWMDTGVTQCRFSIDAATSDTYEKVRPGGPVKDYLTGEFKSYQDRLTKIKEKVIVWFGKKGHCPTRHVYVVCKRNKSEIVPYLRFWQPWLGPNDEIVVKSVLTYGGVIHKGTPDFDGITDSNPCNVWSQDSMTIAWNGDITPCNLDVNVGLRIGNIKNNTLKELHRGQKWQQLKKLSDRREISPCKTCHDANNWSKNVVVKKGDKINNAIANSFSS